RGKWKQSYRMGNDFTGGPRVSLSIAKSWRRICQSACTWTTWRHAEQKFDSDRGCVLARERNGIHHTWSVSAHSRRSRLLDGSELRDVPGYFPGNQGKSETLSQDGGWVQSGGNIHIRNLRPVRTGCSNFAACVHGRDQLSKAGAVIVLY